MKKNFTANSLIFVESTETFRYNKISQMKEEKKQSSEIYTIGHSNHPLGVFLNLLMQYEIKTIVDTRSPPYSSYSHQFNKDSLYRALREKGIRYVYSGDVLGGRPEGAEFYDAEGYVLYSRIAEAEFFIDAITELKKEIKLARTAILCSEENPQGCHRHLLISRVLHKQGVDIFHIRGNGHIQTEDELQMDESARKGQDKNQLALFDAGEQNEWKSIQSVLQKKRQKSSSTEILIFQ